MIIETIQLRHRPSDEVIPIIKPMLAPEASITGTGYKLPEALKPLAKHKDDFSVVQSRIRIMWY